MQFKHLKRAPHCLFTSVKLSSKCGLLNLLLRKICGKKSHIQEVIESLTPKWAQLIPLRQIPIGITLKHYIGLCHCSVVDFSVLHVPNSTDSFLSSQERNTCANRGLVMFNPLLLILPLAWFTVMIVHPTSPPEQWQPFALL